jgi:predicted ATPase/class 3 adenylate cyclase
MAVAELPTGTVTFLFTDVEGSTRLLHELGAERYAEALAEHRRLLREAFGRYGGVEVDTQGDAFFFAFADAKAALAAARDGQAALEASPIRVRVGIHTGNPVVTDEGYVGDDVHLAARVAASAHGGQVVVSQATRALVDERQRLTQLGEHRLTDIAEPVAIFQLGGEQFPPLKTISNTNLPRPVSSFVGRERELEEVLAKIEDGARLVTLTGPGGSGKTRLALEAAVILVPEYNAGVFWVGLAPVRDPALVTETIAQTLGAKNGLTEHIGKRAMLLLLDNLEQVIEAAPELSTLLQRCPNLTLLVTSRELLRVQGEVEYPLPPLAAPEAVALFCERTRLDPSEDIADLCARLDNLPLALELAAARTKALSPTQILARLSQRLDLLKGGRDTDPRQQTLRATIAWSYDLLTEDEQQLFRRLSVFAGGCTLEAAEDVALADLDTLQSLVEKSLLRFSEARYWMLETIREYASEQLETSGESDDLHRRHAELVAMTAEVALAPLAPAFGTDIANWRAALAWAFERGEARTAARLVKVAAYWRPPVSELLRQVRRALRGAAASLDPLDEARLHFLNALWSVTAGEPAAGVPSAERALDLYRRLEDHAGEFNAVHALAAVAVAQGDLGRASDLAAIELELVARFGDELKPWRADALSLLAEIERQRGNFDQAWSFLEQALEHGNANIRGWLLLGLAEVALERVELKRSRDLWTDALRHAHEHKQSPLIAYALGGLAVVAFEEGDRERAGVLWAMAQAVATDLGIRFDEHIARRWYRRLEALNAEEIAAGTTAGAGLTADEAASYALSLD